MGNTTSVLSNVTMLGPIANYSADGITFSYQNYTDKWMCNNDVPCGPEPVLGQGGTGKCVLWPDGVMACASFVKQGGKCTPMASSPEWFGNHIDYPVNTYLNEKLGFEGFCDGRTMSCDGSKALCLPLLKEGEHCRGGFLPCASGLACLDGKCSRALKLRYTCEQDEECASGICGRRIVPGSLVEAAEKFYPNGECSAKRVSQGDGCITDMDCASRKCIITNRESCKTGGLTCWMHCRENGCNSVCEFNPEPFFCTGSCAKYAMADERCTLDANCESELFCNINAAEKKCTSKLNYGDKCNRDRMCKDSLVCLPSFTCGDKLPKKSICSRGSHCRSGKCSNEYYCE